VYLTEVDRAAMDLIKVLYNYDVNHANSKHNPYSSKPKIHFLMHLTDDIKRFGTALNFETEKGEQFNKHIREHLFFTNRLNTSRDVCLKFGKQSMIQHIVDGGSWLNRDGLREKTGEEVVSFIDEHKELCYKNLFGGSREFADNNDSEYQLPDLRNNHVAVFIDSLSRPFIGIVSDDKVYYLTSYSGTLQDNCLVLCQMNEPVFALLNEVKLQSILDVHTSPNDRFYINLSKFGTYWTFLNNARNNTSSNSLQ
jgi:hypothetical protein